MMFCCNINCIIKYYNISKLTVSNLIIDVRGYHLLISFICYPLQYFSFLGIFSQETSFSYNRIFVLAQRKQLVGQNYQLLFHVIKSLTNKINCLKNQQSYLPQISFFEINLLVISEQSSISCSRMSAMFRSDWSSFLIYLPLQSNIIPQFHLTFILIIQIRTFKSI